MSQPMQVGLFIDGEETASAVHETFMTVDPATAEGSASKPTSRGWRHSTAGKPLWQAGREMASTAGYFRYYAGAADKPR